MSDDTTQSGLTVPPEVERQFPDLIALIRSSESMNDEERQYWVDILPVMTPEQVEQLRGILQNERDQLAAIDAKYAQEISKVGDIAALQKMEEERRSKQQERFKIESDVREQEEKSAEDILSNLE
jgi:hypothetical protein